MVIGNRTKYFQDNACDSCHSNIRTEPRRKSLYKRRRKAAPSHDWLSTKGHSLRHLKWCQTSAEVTRVRINYTTVKINKLIIIF